ncbi:MAG: YdcF family protein [Sphingorhabdus sp.]
MLDESLEARIFPLFSYFLAVPEWQEALAADPVLQRLASNRAARVPAEACTPAPHCITDAWIWTDEDIKLVDLRLRSLVKQPSLTDALIKQHMRPAGRFARHEALNNADLLSAAWQEAARGINRVIAVYGQGKAPMYPKIDSMIFDTTSAEFPNLMRVHSVATVSLTQDTDLFFQPAVRYAAGLLMMNERTEAGSFRPVLEGTNAATVKEIPGTNWTRYAYPAILVFGHGPEDPQSGTGPLAHVRLRLAAQMFMRGLAPFIIVSGGNVHPNRTKSNESVEMKRLLVELHNIPANRILIEPHARHTTTNLRNSARLLFASGIPTDRPSLIVSDHLTIQYIKSSVLFDRNLREMGVQPGRVEAGPDKFTALFTPDRQSFYVEVTDPLDP